MSLDPSTLTTVRGYAEGDAASAAPQAGVIVTEYKRWVSRRYLSLNPDQIEHRLGGSSWQVTRKYDGELAVIIYDGAEVYTVNTGGRIRHGLAVHAEALAQLRAANVREAVIAAELHVCEDAGRGRVFDVAAALADPSRLAELRLSVFDIVSVDGEEHRPASYLETHGWLTKVFTGPTVSPVQLTTAGSRAQVAEVFAEWVTQGGAEGLVVRADLPVVYKIKPVHTLDVAVIGYSENPDAAGQVRSLLVALATPDGSYQPIGHVGSGLTEASRAELHARLSPAEVGSSYIETDSNHVAFHMVRPEVVAEIRINDVLFESGSGPQLNPLLSYAGTWSRTGTAVGVSIIHPVLVRMRDDKTASGVDVRLEQIEENWSWPVPALPRDPQEASPATVLRREVYTKQLGGKLMVQKFLAWRTNKAQDYPGYVLAYTNFSSGRAQPLATEVRITNSEQQLLELTAAMIAANVKSGWQRAEP